MEQHSVFSKAPRLAWIKFTIYAYDFHNKLYKLRRITNPWSNFLCTNYKQNAIDDGRGWAFDFPYCFFLLFLCCVKMAGRNNRKSTQAQRRNVVVYAEIYYQFTTRIYLIWLPLRLTWAEARSKRTTKTFLNYS